MGDLRNEVIKNMRSCMISKKERLSVRQLYNDYKTIIGEAIPYQKLGYKTLEDLIQSAPTEFNLKGSGHEFYVSARDSEKSAHITEMVAKQKAAKQRPPRVRFSRGPPPPRLQQMQKWRPKSNIPNKYQGSPRPQAVSHAQFVNRGPTVIYKAPSVASKVVIPEHSNYNSKPPQAATVPPQAATVPPPAATVLPPGKRPDLNQRLTNRLKENKAWNGNGPMNFSSNGTSNISNTPSTLYDATQKPGQKKTVINNDTLNPLVSTKKRIIRMISELNLERDSGTSSPTSETSPLSPLQAPDFVRTFDSPPDFVRTFDSLVDLKSFAELHKLGEVVVNITQIRQKRDRFYSCKIKVGLKHTYSSYPKEFPNQLAAQNCCCEKALEDLIPKFKRKSLMIASERDILDRIPPMLEKHPHGIWASQVKHDYSDKYNELLSEDWLKIIDSSPCVHIQKQHHDYILQHCRPGDVLQKGQLRSVPVPVSNVSVPANTVQSGEDGKLSALVTCAMSASEIWCQQTCTVESERYAEMMDRLQVYYVDREDQLLAKSIATAGYYIAKYDGEYYRVRAVKVDELEVGCFFIDWGDELSIPRSDIFDLDRKYASAQAQAFVCRLYGLEELYEVSNNSQSLARLYEKPVVVEIAVDVTNNAHTNDALAVYMYDSETGKSINEDLISKLTMELASPTLNQEGITEVYVSNIESNGDVYVQVRSQGYENWMKLKRQIEEDINKKPPREMLYKVNRSNSGGKLYFYKQLVKGNWSRVKLIDWSPEDKGDLAQIYFVDEGHTHVIDVTREDLYPLETLNDIFNNYPYQAVRVRISLDVIPPNFLDLATKLMPEGHPVLLKLEGTTQDGIPLVKLFRRNTDDCLFCINTSVSLDAEIKKEENNNMKGKFKFGGQDCVPSTGALKCPDFPEIGKDDYWELYVPVAVSPYNFFVQPLKTHQNLNEMMERLQARYQNVQYGNLRVEDVMPGSIYASKHEDGFWYRTSVIKVIHSGSVSVFYCDFGYYQTVPVKQLIPLDREFMDLPYQALKAKLAGVKPTQNKWTMDDCERFKELIEKKRFQALLLNTEKDILYESDLVLKLEMIDTTTEEDIFVVDELVTRGIAVRE